MDVDGDADGDADAGDVDADGDGDADADADVDGDPDADADNPLENCRVGSRRFGAFWAADNWCRPARDQHRNSNVPEILPPGKRSQAGLIRSNRMLPTIRKER